MQVSTLYGVGQNAEMYVYVYVYVWVRVQGTEKKITDLTLKNNLE